jgi:hypothetical protein
MCRRARLPRWLLRKPLLSFPGQQLLLLLLFNPLLFDLPLLLDLLLQQLRLHPRVCPSLMH